MDVTTQRRCLGAIAGGLIVGAAGTIFWSLSGIDQPSAEASMNQKRKVQPEISRELAQPFDDHFANQSLRGPLYDPPRSTTPQTPPRKPPEPQPKSSLDLTLVGTIIEAKQSLAILADSSGKFDIKGIGESLELSPQGITLQEIESEQVILQYQGRKSTVQLDRKTKKPVGDGTGRRNNRRRNQ